MHLPIKAPMCILLLGNFVSTQQELLLAGFSRESIYFSPLARLNMTLKRKFNKSRFAASTSAILTTE